MISVIKNFLFWQPENFSFNSLVFFFSHWFLWLIIFGLTLFWLLKNKLRQLKLFWLLIIFSELLEITIKHFSPWQRPFYQNGVQPPEWIVDYSRGSFPSGHAIRSAIVLSFLWQENKALLWPLLPGIILVNLGRVLFGLHYPIDILAGLVLGYLLVKIRKLMIKKFRQ